MVRYENGVIVYSGKDLYRGAHDVIHNKLFNVEGVICGYMLQIIANKHKKHNVEIALFESKAMAYRSKNIVMAYCNPKFRRKGFATLCVSALKLRKNPIAFETRYKDFWKHQKKKISVLEND